MPSFFVVKEKELVKKKKVRGIKILMFIGNAMLGQTQKFLKWVKGALSKSVQSFDRFSLLLDNLKSQDSDELKFAVTALHGVAWFELKTATDQWKVVDAGLAQMVKVLIRQVH